MPCKDCFDNCGEKIYDKCVQYTGDDIELLGICNGDNLFKVEEIILEKLVSALDGTGITLEDVTLENCPLLAQKLVGKNSTLVNIIQVLWDNQCTLKELIDKYAPKSYSFNTTCLTGLPSNPTSDDILQSALFVLCNIKTVVDSFATTYVKNSDLNNSVLQIIQSQKEESNVGSTALAYKDRMVPYMASPYFGPVSNFDNTGKGLASVGFDKIYLCNGQNGTPDIRGRAVIGAVRNVPGGTLDTAVSPANPLNISNVDYSVGDKVGENFHQQTSSEMPIHTHPVIDPGHKHSLPPDIQYNGASGGGESGTDEKAPPQNKQTTTSQTGISVGSAGGGLAFNVRQPSIASLWIIHIP